MEPVLDAPMASHELHQSLGTDLVGREAGDKIPSFVADQALPIADFDVDTQNQLDAWERSDLADVGDLFAIEDPELADVDLAFFLSRVSTSGGRPVTSPRLT
jgi:hypothetical protein